MTVLSRGEQVRRSRRKLGWLLLTALLVLAIAASSALVFTDRVQLLRFAVILALWAAVVAAFVSVIYRRQSDADQVRARDLKLVYDLQLDREISARREYELTVESQLRRELASELRAAAADEVAALRAELSALRTSLEILFDTNLDQRPALENQRRTARGYRDWGRDDESPDDRVKRVTSVRAEKTSRPAEDSSIIDVAEEPLVSPTRQASATANRAAHAYQDTEAYRGPDRQPADRGRVPQHQQPARGRWAARERGEPRHDQPEPALRSDDHREASPQQQPQHSATNWQPVGPEGRWLPPGTPGSNWTSDTYETEKTPAGNSTPRPEPTLAAVSRPRRQGRHSGPADPVVEAARRNPARHSAEHADSGSASRAPETPPRSPPPTAAPPRGGRHRGVDPWTDAEESQTGGQSVADLLTRLQASPSGGRRRRRED
jgi:hypothetical protein